MECVHVHVRVHVDVDVDVVVEGARFQVSSFPSESPNLGFPLLLLRSDHTTLERNSHWEISIAAPCIDQLIELDDMLVIEGIMSTLSRPTEDT